jgi:hypothetical protein
VRLGNIALMPEEPIETRDYGFMEAYLIEARSIGGLSGSPVFVHVGGIRANRMRGNKYYWLGLIHGHWNLPTSDTDNSNKDQLSGEAINTGIAIVVPATKILEIINRKELVEGRVKVAEEKKVTEG